jgi:hypothetical protein
VAVSEPTPEQLARARESLRTSPGQQPGTLSDAAEAAFAGAAPAPPAARANVPPSALTRRKQAEFANAPTVDAARQALTEFRLSRIADAADLIMTKILARDIKRKLANLRPSADPKAPPERRRLQRPPKLGAFR